MILTLKKGVKTLKVYDNSGILIALIKKQRGSGKQRLIIDVNRNEALQTKINNDGNYTVYHLDNSIASAQPIYETDNNGNPIQRIITRPSMIHKLNINSKYGSYTLVQKPNRVIILIKNGEEIGTFDKMLEINNKIIIHENSNIIFLVALYVLASYMIEENDVDIV